MKNHLLLPHSYKIVGWVLLLPALVAGIALMFFNYSLPFMQAEHGILSVDFSDELIGIVLILALVLVGFSRLKLEDEYTFRIRLEAFQLAFYIYAAIMAIAILVIYNDAFFNFMVINLFTPLLLFVLIFHIRIIAFRISGS